MRLKYALILTIFLASLAACNEKTGVEIPLDTIYYPSYVLADPLNRGLAYVVNANFDLQYTSGSLLVIDLADLSKDGAGLASIYSAGSLRIDSFGGQLAMRHDGQRAVIPIRGAASLLTMEVSADGKTLSCKVSGQNCFEKSQKLLPEKFGLPDVDVADLDDFFALTFVPSDSDEDRLMLGTLGYSSLLPLTWPQGTFELSAESGYDGPKGGIAELMWLDGTSQLIGASQFSDGRDSRLFITSTFKPPVSVQYIDIFQQFAGSSINAIAKVDNKTLLLSNTFPHTLVLVDLDFKDSDRPRGIVRWSTALEGESADIVVYDHKVLGKLALASIIDTDVIEVFSVSSGLLLGRIATEGGPYSMALVKGKDGTDWLLVTEFYNHGLAIYDISANSVSEFSLKQRINDGTHKTAKRDN